MASVQNVIGARTALTTTAHNSLANGTYVSAGVVTTGAVQELSVEVIATPATVSGTYPRVYVFCRISSDGTNYTTGPISGTTITNEDNLYRLGSLPLKTSATIQAKRFDVKALLGVSYVPAFVEVVLKNETGSALAASGNSVYYNLVTTVIV
jgi:hypothetical protein